jgi:SMI1 / KNR4 family (SUKH-1)
LIIKEANKFGPLDETALIKFEKKLKARLPEQYRKFLLENNGGKVTPYAVLLQDGTSAYLQTHFYGIHDGPNYTSLKWNFSILKNRIPHGMLPITHDPGGNAILIKYKGENTGSLYFWDHNYEGEPNSIVYITNDFELFLNSVYEPVPEDKTLVDKIIRTEDINLLTNLVNEGYDLEQEVRYGRTIIEYAAMYGKYKLFVWLAEKKVAIRESLEYAQKNKNQEIVEFILAMGADKTID